MTSNFERTIIKLALSNLSSCFWDKSFFWESDMILIRGSGLGHPLGYFSGTTSRRKAGLQKWRRNLPFFFKDLEEVIELEGVE